MKFVLNTLGLTLSLFFIFNANLLAQNNASKAYYFIIAGHTYGSPKKRKINLHPPFVTDFDYINNFQNMTFGVFTGDIVYRSRADYWDKAVRNNKLTFVIRRSRLL